MKTTICLCALALLASCTPNFSKVNNACLDLKSAVTGKVTFQLNDIQDKDSIPKYSNFPRHYLIVVFDDKERENPIDARILMRKTAIEQFIQLDNTKLKEYCVVIYKDQNLAGYKQMEWQEMSGKKVSLIQKQNVFYASSTNKYLLVKEIASKDHAAGDGVKAVIY
jgi:hypothetical protein